MKPIILNHPLIEHKLSILRDKNTGTKEFRELISEISMLLCYEAVKNVPTYEKIVETPMTTTKTRVINEDFLAFMPILRAGIGMIEGIIRLIPNAKIGHIGLYRDEETFKPVKYYFKAPKRLNEKETIILDPMIATGGSAIDAITMLKEEGATNIKFLCIIAAPEGLKKIDEVHPDVEIFCATVDEGLNENCYILPGLGDAGDRIFGAK